MCYGDLSFSILGLFLLRKLNPSQIERLSALKVHTLQALYGVFFLDVSHLVNTSCFAGLQSNQEPYSYLQAMPRAVSRQQTALAS